MKHIIALGGGGFSMEPENPLLDSYILAQAQKSKPNICFIPTASGDSEGYIQNFYTALDKHECTPSHLSLFSPPQHDLRRFIMEKDILYVGGGNTKNLLAIWREWRLDVILREAWEAGIILAGLSAGSGCWFEEMITDSSGDKLEPLPCLGFLKGSHCPHYDGEEERRPAYQQLILNDQLQGGYAADDGAALHFTDDKLARAVSSRPNAKVYRVEKRGYRIIEQALTTDYLGEG